MIPQGKCPKCKKIVIRVTIEAVPIDLNLQEQWKGVSFVRPSEEAY